MWDAWKTMFLECVDKHAPLRTKRVRTSKSPWITPQLKKRMHERDFLKVKAIRSKNPIDLRTFTKCRNSVNEEVKRTKQIYFKNAIHDNRGNMRNTWKIINELMYRSNRTSNIPPGLTPGI